MPIHKITPELVQEIKTGYRNLLSLNLSNNDIQVIENLEPLSQLEKLDLSNNQLTKIENLDCLELLRELAISANSVRHLTGLDRLHLLSKLDIRNNKIDSFAEISRLRPLSALKELNLEKNPIAEEPGYRQRVVTILSGLRMLDGVKVEEGERRLARLQAADQDIVPENDFSGKPEPLSMMGSGDVKMEVQEQFDALWPKGEETAASARESRSVELALVNRMGMMQTQLHKVQTELEGSRTQFMAAQQRADMYKRQFMDAQIDLDKCRSQHDVARSDLAEERKVSSAATAQVSALRVKVAESNEIKQVEINNLRTKLQAAEGDLAAEKIRAKHLAEYIAKMEEDRELERREEVTKEEDQLYLGVPVDRDTVMNNLRDENTALAGRLDMFGARVDSLKEIVAIQQRTLEGDEADGDLSVLLTSWREKVFELLVRNRSLEFQAQKREAEFQAEVKATLSRQKDLERRLLLVSEEKKEVALELEMQKAGMEFAKSTIGRGEARQAVMEKRLREAEAQLKRVKDLSEFGDQSMRSIVKMNAKLSALAQRVDFGVSRIRMVAGLVKGSGSRPATPNSDDSGAPKLARDVSTLNEERLDIESLKGVSSSILLKEVARLHADRAYLLKEQTQHDRKTKDREETLEADHQLLLKAKEDEIVRLAQELQSLRDSTAESMSVQKEAKAAVTSLQAKLNVSESQYKDLNSMLSKERVEHSAKMTNVVRELTRDHEDRVSALEGELAETRKDAAKYKITSTELGRRLDEAKNKLAQRREAMFAELESELNRVKSSLEQVKRQRDMLLTSLKAKVVTSPRGAVPRENVLKEPVVSGEEQVETVIDAPLAESEQAEQLPEQEPAETEASEVPQEKNVTQDVLSESTPPHEPEAALADVPGGPADQKVDPVLAAPGPESPELGELRKLLEASDRVISQRATLDGKG